MVGKLNIDRAIKKYLLVCKSDGLLPKTISDKGRHLGLFSSCVKKQTSKITIDDIQNFILHLNTTDIRKWRIKVDLRAFFRFLNERKLSDLTYTLIKNKEPELGIRPQITEEENQKIIKVLDDIKSDRKTYTKWRAIHNFLYETGLRAKELLSITMDDIDLNKKIFVVTTAKTHKKRYGFYLTPLDEYVKKYKPKDKLFAISYRELNYIITQLRKSAKIRHITPHSYRHAYVTRLLTNGCPIQQVALLSGHTKVSTTMRYYHETNLKGAYDSFIKSPKTFEVSSKIGLKSKYNLKIQITKNR